MPVNRPPGGTGGTGGTPRLTSRRTAASRSGTGSATARSGAASRPGSAARTGTAARPGATSRSAAARPSARPGDAPRGRRPGTAQRTPRSLKRLAILGCIFVVLAITLMPTLRLYLSQQSDRNALRAQVAEQSRSVQELTKQAQSWNDPAYVEQQARQRLKFVRPGEKSFTVIDPPQAPAAKGTPQVAAGSSGTSPNTPWYGQLWQSLVIADTPGVASSSAPKVPLAPGSTQPPTPGSTPGATSGSTPGSTPGATSESTPGAVSGTGAASGAGSTSGAAAPGAKATR